MKRLTIILIAGLMGFSAVLSAGSKTFDSKKIESMLVNSKGKKAKAINLEDKKYILIYFSAHWCPPCRRFTPKLVKFYNELNKGRFEVILVSSDRSKKDQLNYMTSTSMPWPAIKFSKIKSSGLKSFSGPGIPCLVVLKPDGTVVADSYVNGKYVGPQKVLHELKKLLEKK